VSHDNVIETPRLRLELLLPVALTALRVRDFDGAARAQGFVFTEEFMNTVNDAFLTRQIEGFHQRASTPGWFARAIVRKEDERLIGHCGFHGTPEDIGRAEIGYTVFEPYRRQGYASEAVLGLLEWAKDHDATTVFASVLVDNSASLAVVAKVGFEQTGYRDTNDGKRELVFQWRWK
jgi:RimJ/RimL family protein N-acetyltransferase